MSFVYTFISCFFEIYVFESITTLSIHLSDTLSNSTLKLNVSSQLDEIWLQVGLRALSWSPYDGLSVNQQVSDSWESTSE